EDEFATLRQAGKTTVPGKSVFTLNGTFGFPWDLTEIIAEERGFAIDKQGYDAELAAAKERSRFAGGGSEAIDILYKRLAGDLGATRFTGYDGRGTSGGGTVRA